MANPAAVLRILVTANGAQAIGSLRAVEGQAAKTATASERMGKALNTAGKFAALGTGILAGASIKMATDFDKSMRNVNSIAQLPEKNLKTLEKQVLNLAGKTAQAPKTLAEGLYDLVSSGFDAKQSMVILHASAKAATAGLTDTAVSTKAVAAVLNAYHKPAKDAAKVSDTLFQTVNLGVITFEELASSIGDVLPFASQMGVSLDAIGAAVSTMTKAGISAPETMTRLKNVMVAFLKPSKELTATFENLGVAGGVELIKKMGGGRVGFQRSLEAIVNQTLSAKDLQKAYQDLGVSGFDELKKKAGSASKANMELATTLSGNQAKVASLFPNIRALGGALALTGRNTKGAEADLKAFGNTSGATNKALSQQSQSLAYQWQKLRVQVSALLIELGMKFIPTLIKVTEWFMKNKGALKTLASAIAVAGAAWVAYRTYALLAAAATTLASGGLNLIIPALAAMAVGIAIAYKRSETFRKIVTGVFSVVKTIIVDYVHIILTVLDKWLGGLQAVMEAASHLPIVGKKFRGIADDIGHAREKVRGLRDAVDNLNGRKISVQVQVNALLDEFQSGKIPKLVTGKIPAPKRAMGGLVVGGSGSGDKVPLQAMVEPGEQVFVLNRNASSMLDYLQGVNASVPRFAAGGKLNLAHPGRQLRRAAVEMGESASAGWLKAHPMAASGARASSGVPGGPVPAGSARGWLTKALKITGHYSASNLAALYLQMMSESGGNPFAINLWDSNAKAGHPSKGLLQTIDSTFNTYAIPGLGNIWNPVANAAAAIRYMYATYGHIVGTGHGYQSGGLVAGIAKTRKKAKPPKPPAQSMHWNPFTNKYEFMTSAQFKALQARWVRQHPNERMPSGPAHAQAKSRHWNPFQQAYQMMTSKAFKALQTRWTKLHPKLRMPSGPTAPTKKPGASSQYQRVADLISDIDLGEQAGILTHAQAVAQEMGVYSYALAHPKKLHLSGRDVAQLMADQRALSAPAGGATMQDAALALAQLTPGTADDIAALQALQTTDQGNLAAAIASGDPQAIVDAASALKEINDQLGAFNDNTQALADALKAVQDEMKRNNDINEGTLAITAREATRAMTDVLAGQLGYRVNTAGFSPGFGVGARY